MKFHKISWKKYQQDCHKLASQLKNKKIDKIIAISRGGLVVSRIMSDLLSVPISHITIASYANLKQEKEALITEVSTKTFDHETILIVDEICDTGKTFMRALSYFKNFPIKKIYTLTLYLKSRSKFTPDFSAEKNDSWVIFPYEVRETSEAFTKLFGKSKSKKKLLAVGFEEWEFQEL
jgi:xanthine phosphoribosyltransferase